MTAASPVARSVEIRPVVAGDIAAVAALHVAAFADTEEDAVARAASSLREELDRPWAHLQVAARGGAPIGYLLVWIVADEVHILDVATHPSCRREGVGAALVQRILELAREHRASRLLLEVRSSNDAAIGLYRRFGFSVFGRRTRYYRDDEDALEMSLLP